MSTDGWQLPTQGAQASPDTRFTGAGPGGATSHTYAPAPRPGAGGAAPYDVAELPWAWQSGGSAPAAPAPPVEAFPGTEHVDLAATLGGRGYEGRPPRTDPLAILALCLGIAGVVPWVGLGAIAIGHVSLWRLGQQPYLGGRGPALTGTVLGYLTVAMHVLLRLFLETVRSAF